MKHQLLILGLVLSILCLLGGIVDLYIQYDNSDGVEWRIPLILISVGGGLPLVIFPFFEWNKHIEPEVFMSDEEYARARPDGGVLSSPINSPKDGILAYSDTSDAGGGD